MFEYLFSKVEKNSIYILTIYLIITTLFSNDPFVLLLNISTIFLFISKWVTNINICTAGYLECRLRNVDRTNSYIYRILDGIVSVNKTKFIYFYYTVYMILLVINIIKFYKSGFNLLDYKDYLKYIKKYNKLQ